MAMPVSETFLWHDYETFGADPRRDRPVQFAALRTDTDLAILEDPVVWYAAPADDVLPHPDACLITGITPQYARQHGVRESEFAGRIAEEMGRAGTCCVGFNNFRFDDEVTRYLFYRNFIDPYEREWARGNSRFDLIDVVRMMRALRPEGLDWPDRDDGTPSFRLEDLARANDLDTGRAHDALADVHTTLELARKLAAAQPKLWRWALSLRDRFNVTRMLSPDKPLVHVSARYPARWCGLAPVLPLAEHPRFRGQWLVWNLREDPVAFTDYDSETLADLLFTPAADLPEDMSRLPVKLIRSNRCPMIAPMAVIDSAARKRLDIDLRTIARHSDWLRHHPDFIARLRAIHEPPPATTEPDPELALYSGFIPDHDRRQFGLIRDLDGHELAGMSLQFDDPRLPDLLFRYRARNWPESLTGDERDRWTDYRRRRLVDDPELSSIRLDDYRQHIARLRRQDNVDGRLLDALEAWIVEIGLDGLSDSSTENQ